MYLQLIALGPYLPNWMWRQCFDLLESRMMGATHKEQCPRSVGC